MTRQEKTPGRFRPFASARLLASAALIAAVFPASAGRLWSGQAAGKDKEMAEALSRFQSAKASFAKGKELFSTGALAMAAREFEACVKTFPGHVYAFYYLANVHYVGRAYPEALAAIENAERHLDLIAALDDYARKKQIQDLEEAKDLLEAQNEARTSCRESRTLEQMVLDVETEEAKTLKQMERDKARRLRQASQYAYFHGNILFQLRKFDEAFQSYDRAVRIDPENGDAYNNAAAILFLAGRLSEADQLLQKAVAAGVEDRINLKLKKAVTEGLGKSSAGILEQEFGVDGPGDIGTMRFSINPYEGQPGQAPLFVNTYIAFDKQSLDAVIIDPGAADPRLEAFVMERKLKPRLILNTHGHYDHRHGNARYAGLYGIPVAVPKEDLAFYKSEAGDPGENAVPVKMSPELRAGTLLVRSFPTPGHTPGGVCLLVGEFLFTGDSLFEDGIGRIGAGSAQEERKILDIMIGRLEELLAGLPAETALLPGHGRATTPARVRELNPYFKKKR